jgi:predicted nuclease with TOPRIM domain
MEANFEHETIKIPDFILLKESIKENKQLLVQIGQLKGEIDYLNNCIKELQIKDKITQGNEIVAKIKKEEMYTLLKKRNNQLAKRVNRQLKIISNLSAQNIQLQNNIDSLKLSNDFSLFIPLDKVNKL